MERLVAGAHTFLLDSSLLYLVSVFFAVSGRRLCPFASCNEAEKNRCRKAVDEMRIAC